MKKIITILVGLMLIGCSNEEQNNKIGNNEKSEDDFKNSFMNVCMLNDDEKYKKYCECNYDIYIKVDKKQITMDEYDDNVRSKCLGYLN